MRPAARAWVRRIRDGLAVVGLVLLAGGALTYMRGWSIMRELDPRAARVLAEFARTTLEQDAAAASAVTMPLAAGLRIEDAVEAMRLRARAHGFELRSLRRLHTELSERTGEPAPFLEIFQVCDIWSVTSLLAFDSDLVVHLPCRIALYEDAQGQRWLATVNLELLIHGGRDAGGERKTRAVAVKDALLDIMTAGASGILDGGGRDGRL